MIWSVRWMAVAALAGALGGCAVGKDPRDPFENFNRAMFNVNDAVDRNALRPAAEIYSENVPSFVQTGVYNFFGNIGDVWTAINNLLQGKVGDGLTDVMRVAVNSVLGFGGVLDIASEAGMPKHKQDFGATLGVWGVGAGPYVVLPFFGPSTLRDSVALPVDVEADLWTRVYPVNVRNTGIGLRVVDLRAGVLDATGLIEDAALDRYEFVKDGFLQRRAGKINEGRSTRSDRDTDRSDDQKNNKAGSAEKGASQTVDVTVASAPTSADAQEPMQIDNVQFSILPPQPLVGMHLPMAQKALALGVN